MGWGLFPAGGRSHRSQCRAWPTPTLSGAAAWKPDTQNWKYARLSSGGRNLSARFQVRAGGSARGGHTALRRSSARPAPDPISAAVWKDTRARISPSVGPPNVAGAPGHQILQVATSRYQARPALTPSRGDLGQRSHASSLWAHLSLWCAPTYRRLRSVPPGDCMRACPGLCDTEGRDVGGGLCREVIRG